MLLLNPSSEDMATLLDNNIARWRKPLLAHQPTMKHKRNYFMTMGQIAEKIKNNQFKNFLPDAIGITDQKLSS